MNPDKVKKILNKQKEKTINGVIFVFKKISILDFFEDKVIPFGFNQTVDEKRIQERIKQDLSFDKLKDHYKSIFFKSVVKPKLSEKDEVDAVCVDELFNDWDMCNKLYEEIFKLSFGKKKIFRRFLRRG